MMMSRGTAGEGDVRYHPFTASQWQELEQQALVYKYIISGMPIPPDLLFTIKTSLDSCSNLILHHQPPHPTIGWKCLGMGIGRKIDPEPGRCRRTDGKKWRCSKEAYPDSKYCERHMHRGRNRSRKPVEVDNNNTTAAKSPNYPSPNSHPLISSSSSSSSSYYYSNTNTNVLSSQDYCMLESTPYRKRYGMREEHSFLSESCGGGIKRGCWQLEPLGINNNSVAHDYHQPQNGYGYSSSSYQQQKQDEHQQQQKQRVMHHFFDEWPPNYNEDTDSTQLSISIPPTSAHDFFLTHK